MALDRFQFSSSALFQTLRGIDAATKSQVSNSTTAAILEWLESLDQDLSSDKATLKSCSGWLDAVATAGHLQPDSVQIARLAIAISFLRETCNHGTDPNSVDVSATDLAVLWRIVREALTNPSFNFSASRSAQGFLAVPLCSLIQDGNITELFRLHVWIPDGNRGIPDFAVHSHQPFAQSWILAGEAKDHSYSVEAAPDPSLATHAKYKLAWSQGSTTSTNYTTQQTFSEVENTKLYMKASRTRSAIYRTNDTYSIPAGAFHTSEVAPDVLHATLFFFNSHQGFIKDAPVLGPIGLERSRQSRDSAGITPADLAISVDTVRSLEALMEQGKRFSQRCEWEHALQVFNKALILCDSGKIFSDVAHYRSLVVGEIGGTNRRLGG